MRFLVLILLVCGCSADHDSDALPPAQAIVYRGIDMMPTNSNIPCDSWLRALSAAEFPATGLVWDTFGTDRTCVERFISENAHRPHLVRIHLTNESFRDEGRTGYEGDLFRDADRTELNNGLESRDPAFVEVLRARINEISSWIRANENGQSLIVFSTGLEDVYTDAAFALVRELIAEQFSGMIIRNPLTRGPNEQHGGAAQCSGETFIASEDGDAHDANSSRDFLSRNSECLVSFLWRGEHQGRFAGEEVKPPRERDFIFPFEEEMIELLAGAR